MKHNPVLVLQITTKTLFRVIDKFYIHLFGGIFWIWNKSDWVRENMGIEIGKDDGINN